MTQKTVSGAIFIEAGAEEAIVPALWGQDTFIEKAGGSEIIGQMWAFEDKAGRACCLIPEATALFQERSEALLDGRREALFFYVARCYRYERPQAGRYREFTQLGLEILGPSPQQALQRSQTICTGFLDSQGLDYELNTAVKRGLSYYLNGNGFEVRCSRLGAQQQVVGGGAYREGAGFGIGLERLVLALGSD
ncbi:ATP phosphoribosyltransferase regulatory subunit [Pseudomonas syringae pv. tagetis]|uniref:tRNA synthetase, s-II n=2 Tax=Pseudomonas syringae group genomosp. 7 TaxID=251699 RepID=A0A0P9S9Y5_9PSED|nr:ATP phosphoribosyltransferase regulatory subunit [Pseudomonas syringae group genomosp. 7]KPX48465.1 tRNA synthetase, s-II [Pseudomonas syringae pv. helianthi]RMR09372.1 tRNA synthetase, s-II [Pseudomonas syringae pv. helianthi]RMV42908.1 tRNA synthetase, s-II [Pseudomonas syringae pv. helianthi]RMW16822.1 tRNA synthetase s II protein [Pseudomonas syringae pv. tagetis]UNB60931.1 ATP phosphoribosyltransferase regulatory subunit [Pseudomonas syringae pv. helianthi]